MSRPSAVDPRSMMRLVIIVALAIMVVDLVGSVGTWGGIAAAPATTVAPVTTSAVAAQPATTGPATTAPPTTTVVAPTTTAFPGPPPRSSRRIATSIPIAKIRATSLPLRTMGITLACVIAALAASGFVYGRIRSQVPAVAVPTAQPPGDEPIATTRSSGGAAPERPLAPPTGTPLPPPVIEDAVADTVIFEPPPTHRSPTVITSAADDEA